MGAEVRRTHSSEHIESSDYLETADLVFWDWYTGFSAPSILAVVLCVGAPGCVLTSSTWHFHCEQHSNAKLTKRVNQDSYSLTQSDKAVSLKVDVCL